MWLVLVTLLDRIFEWYNLCYASLSRLIFAPVKPFKCASCIVSILGGVSKCDGHVIGL